MRKYLFILLLLGFGLHADAQNIIYRSLKDFVAQSGDTLNAFQFLEVEKRTKAQLMLQTGGDYRVTSNSESTTRLLKRRSTIIVQKDGELYVHCRKLRINRFRLGRFYAPAMAVGAHVYFCAVPVGPAAVAVVNRDIGMGVIGEAVASSSAVSQRVYYELNTETGKVTFVGKDKMIELLADYPELKAAFIAENNEEAHVTGRYLQLLKEQE